MIPPLKHAMCKNCCVMLVNEENQIDELRFKTRLYYLQQYLVKIFNVFNPELPYLWHAEIVIIVMVVRNKDFSM